MARGNQKPKASPGKAKSKSHSKTAGRASKPKLKAMRTEVREAPIRYRGFTLPYQLKAEWEVDGDEALIHPKEALERDKAYSSLRDFVDVCSSAASIKQLRESLNLTQREAGELLGGGANAFQKYESGSTEVSQPMLNLLRLVANDPSRLDELRIASGDLPPPLPKPEKKKNQTFSLLKRGGLSGADLVVVAAEGLKQHVILVELKRKRGNRDWSYITQRMGVKHRGKRVFRQGPLDRQPVENIVFTALEEHGLDPEQTSWNEILEVVDG